MSKKNMLLLLLTATLATACSDQLATTVPVTSSEEPVSTPATLSGMLSVKLRADIAEQLDATVNELQLPTGHTDLDNWLHDIGATRMRRIFPYAGKDEARQQAEGLHTWYTVWYDGQQQLAQTRAMGDYGIADCVEEVRAPQLEKYHLCEAPAAATLAAADGPFDDPLWPAQWNLKNNGNFGNYTTSSGEQIVSSIAGADINVLPAWQQTTGDRRVIVAVVDGGIDEGHEDLAASMWVNSGEIAGNGIDDDNNGYVDDINGWNFVDNTNTIVATDHGTHVAGIIAARSNNGKGICGVAGGDGTADSGVRLISCQIFKPNPDYNPNDPDSKSTISVENYNAMAAAIVYGANNGAVISQNSWGFSDYKEAPQVVREALTYFRQYAGQYEGAPMKGGVCIFSAGNDGTDVPMYPGAYDDVVCVSSFAPDWAAAYYTNYGQHVDICAPGGTGNRGDKYPYASGFQLPSLILSTVPTSVAASGYASMQGTSMACPHVSGIAALVVSKYADSGITSDELTSLLLGGIHPVDPANHNIAKYRDRLGMGYANAAAAMRRPDANVQPPLPAFISDRSKADYYALQVAWSAEVSSSDALQYFTLYYSPSPFSADQIGSSSDIRQYHIPAGFGATGHQEFSRTLSGLGNEQTYYFAVTATAANGHTSAVAVLPNGLTTLRNTAPQVTADVDLSQTLHFAGDEHIDVHFTIHDAEQHAWTYSLVNQSMFYIEEQGDQLLIRIFASKFGTGAHDVTLTVADQYGAERVVTIHLMKDTAPTTPTTPDDQPQDPPAGISGQGLVSLYPTQADDTIQLTLGNDIDGSFTVRIRNAIGKTVTEQQHHASQLSATRTLSVDVYQLYPGRYDLSVIANGQTYTQTFIKK